MSRARLSRPLVLLAAGVGLLATLAWRRARAHDVDIDRLTAARLAGVKP